MRRDAESEREEDGRIPGRRPSRHYLAGRVRCGICGRVATVKENGERRPLMFRCWHRGTSCRQLARSAGGLERAAVRALELVRGDPDLRDAIRRELARSPEGGRAARRRATRLRVLERDRRRLLDLHYAGQISGELFAQEERRLKGKASDVEAENLRIEEDG